MMTEKSGNSEKTSFAVIIAVIGAIATIMTACVTGFFAMVPAVIERLDQEPAPQTVMAAASTATMANTAVPAALDTPVPTIAFTPTPEPTATEQPAAGLLFASKIAANGLALDPASEFQTGITDLYAVFPAGMTLPGTFISADNPQAGSYYAFMQVEPGSTITRIGWRWIYQGAVVNEYEMDVASGNDIWLSYTNPQNGGIFGAAPFGAGKYTIVITMGGSPLISGELVIRP
jgi:hypothetical protein